MRNGDWIQTFSGNKFVQAMEDYVVKDPKAAKVVESLTASLSGKNFTAKEILDRLPIWNKAYSAAGITGKSAQAGVYDVLSKTARNLMKTETPELAKAYAKWASSIAFKEGAKKIFNPVSLGKTLVGAGATAGLFYGLNKITGQNQR